MICRNHTQHSININQLATEDLIILMKETELRLLNCTKLKSREIMPKKLGLEARLCRWGKMEGRKCIRRSVRG